MNHPQAKPAEVSVLDTVAATAGDITVGGGKVNITGLRPFYRKDVSNNQIILKWFLNEILAVQNVYASTFTVGATYKFNITQNVLGEMVNTIITYVPTTTSGSDFATGITAAVQAAINGGIVKATVATYNSGGDYGVAITALTDYALLDVNQTSNVTAANGLAATATTSNGSLSGTVLTLTQTAHGLVVGDTIRYTWTSGTLNGVAGSVGLDLRVMTQASADVVTVWVDSASSYVGTAASSFIRKVATAKQGNGVDLIANGFTTVTSSKTYSYVDIWINDMQNGNSSYTPNPAPTRKVVFFDASSTTNTPLAMARMLEIKKWYGAGATTADPALLS